MKKLGLLWVIAGTLSLGSVGPASRALADDPPPLEPPAAVPMSQDQGRPEPASEPEADSSVVPPRAKSYHEAASTISTSQATPPVHIDKAPPSPVAERAGFNANDPDARWIPGYWDWDPERRDFVWVTGTWRVPPPGRFWVNGFWKRDDQGWYRVPGFWSERKTDIRSNGPPRDLREDRIDPAPGPDYFFIPGQYVPSGDGVTWRPGFWAKAQPGWEWTPARWVRRSEGWSYREGHWERTPIEAASGVIPTRDVRPTSGSVIVSEPFNSSRPGAGDAADPNTRRRVVARPASGESSPFRLDAPGDDRQADPNPANDLAPLPEGGLAPLPKEGSTATPGPVQQQPAPGSNPSPSPTPDPRALGPTTPNPDPMDPRLAPTFPAPITDLYLPGGIRIQVMPRQPPWTGNGPLPYPGAVVPPYPFQTRRPPAGANLRQTIRELIGGGLR